VPSKQVIFVTVKSFEVIFVTVKSFEVIFVTVKKAPFTEQQIRRSDTKADQLRASKRDDRTLVSIRATPVQGAARHLPRRALPPKESLDTHERASWWR
jgi:hypothetical protein